MNEIGILKEFDKLGRIVIAEESRCNIAVTDVFLA